MYRVVTDATADLSDSMLRDLPSLTVIPMNVETEAQSFTYGPDGDITVEAFYEMQKNGHFFKTSQISPSRYLEVFEPIVAEGQDLLYLCFSSGMSGCYQSAQIASAELMKQYPERKIICIDTLSASVGEGFLAMETLRMQQSGLSIDDLALWVDSHKQNVCHWFTVDTFEHLKRGGRVSSAAAVMGTMLQIKPLLRVDEQGKLEVVEKPRGHRNALKAQLKHMKDTIQEPLRIVIGHGSNEETANELAQSIAQELPDAEIHLAEIGPIIGSHTGPGMVALIYWGSHR